jgi:acyl-CoA hydrolase
MGGPPLGDACIASLCPSYVRAIARAHRRSKMAPEKIAAIVITNKPDSASTVSPEDEETQLIAGHLIEFLQHEISHGRMPAHSLPLQVGIGAIANAMLAGFVKASFEPFEIYSEVLHDSIFDRMDANKVIFASGASITLFGGTACAGIRRAASLSRPSRVATARGWQSP